jgi:hypothetical protein
VTRRRIDAPEPASGSLTACGTCRDCCCAAAVVWLAAETLCSGLPSCSIRRLRLGFAQTIPGNAHVLGLDGRTRLQGVATASARRGHPIQAQAARRSPAGRRSAVSACSREQERAPSADDRPVAACRPAAILCASARGGPAVPAPPDHAPQRRDGGPSLVALSAHTDAGKQR